MKKRIKLVNVNATEILNFESFLNQSAREGWVLDKVNKLYLTFRYQPDNSIYYSVVDNKSHKLFLSDDEIEDDKKLTDLASEMGYQLAFTVWTFSIFTKESPEPMYTDDYYTKERIKPVFNYSLIRSLSQIILGVLLTYMILYPLRFTIFSSNIGLFVFVFYPLFVLFGIRNLVNDLRFYSGRYRWDMLKYKDTKTDVLTTFYYLMLMFLILIYIHLLWDGFSMRLLIILFVMGLFFVFINYILGTDLSRGLKIGLLVLSVILMIYIPIASNSLFSVSPLSMPEKGCEILTNEESILVKHTSMSCYDESVYISQYKSKSDFLQEFLNEKFLEMHFFIPSDVPYYQQMVDGDFYVYRGHDFAIVSTSEITAELIDEMMH